MNKQAFMTSMTTASETIMKLGITAETQERYEDSEITKATALAEKEVADKKLPKKEVAAATKKAIALAVKPIEKNLWGKDLSEKAEKAFLLSQKTISAFYMANDKEEWKIVGYSDNLEVFSRMFGTLRGTESWKKNVVNLADMLQDELNLHKPNQNVSHNTGKSWKKDVNDIKRFDELAQCVKDFKEIVS